MSILGVTIGIVEYQFRHNILPVLLKDTSGNSNNTSSQNYDHITIQFVFLGVYNRFQSLDYFK